MSSVRRAPTASPSRHAASDRQQLTRSPTSLSLRTRNISTSPGNDSRKLSSQAMASRRQSAEFRSSNSPPGTSSSQEKALRRTPSTPNIRKRCSLVSLNGSDSTTGTPIGTTSTMRRRSSMLSLNGTSPTAVPEPAATAPTLPPPPPQDMYAEATAILADTSYGHRYSRPRTSAAELANIVERPERIPAAVVGISAAQVRAGRDRLSIRKTTRQGSLSDPEVTLVHAHTPAPRGKQSWPEELTAMCKAAPDKLKKGELEVPKPYHAGDLYLGTESLKDMQGCIGAVYEGVDLVFGDSAVKRAFVCIRPPGHHCAESTPSGFCFLNNVHIAIAHAAKAHGLTHAVILDFDLHHGDGSQAIAWSLNDLRAQKTQSKKKTSGINVPQIAYMSMHDINSFPCENGELETIRNASVNLESHNQFIHNVHMKPYTTQSEFWELYEGRYKTIINKADEFLRGARQVAEKKGLDFKGGIFISAGFDASEHEQSSMQRHSVCVPTDFFAQFTADAVELANDMCEGRVISVLEGGYSDRAITSGVFAHMSALACSPPNRAEFVPSSMTTGVSETYSATTVRWDESWWSLQNLEDLERLTAKKAPKPEKRATSFMSATAASAARQSEAPRRHPPSTNVGGISPPPPPTPWEKRAYELSKHFIPAYQESVPIPDIEKPAAGKRAPSARHSIGGPTERMTLRERKPKPAPAAAPVADKARRRTTGPVLESATLTTTALRATSRATSTRAASRAPSAASTRSVSSRPAPLKTPTGAVTPGARSPMSTTSPTSSTSSGAASSRVYRRTSDGIQALTKGLQKVKITYGNADAEREHDEEVARLEKKAAELESKIAAAREKERKKERQQKEQGVASDVQKVSEELQPSPHLESREEKEARQLEAKKETEVQKQQPARNPKITITPPSSPPRARKDPLRRRSGVPIHSGTTSPPKYKPTSPKEQAKQIGKENAQA